MDPRVQPRLRPTAVGQIMLRPTSKSKPGCRCDGILIFSVLSVTRAPGQGQATSGLKPPHLGCWEIGSFSTWNRLSAPGGLKSILSFTGSWHECHHATGVDVLSHLGQCCKLAAPNRGHLSCLCSISLSLICLCLCLPAYLSFNLLIYIIFPTVLKGSPRKILLYIFISRRHEQLVA